VVKAQKQLADYIKKDEVAAKGYYSVFLDMFEEGISQEEVEEFAEVLRKKLVPFIKKIAAIKLDYNRAFLTRSYPIKEQEILAHRLIALQGLPKDNYQLLTSAHPFSSGLSSDDLRLTTAYHEDNLLSSIFSVIHETGHSLYEFQIDRKYENTILNGGVSMGIHESQSRFYENILARGKSYSKKIYDIVKEIFPTQLEDTSFDDFYKAINEVQLGYIRIEADELSYPLHILLRYELEKRIVGGENIDSLNKLWKDLFKEYFGFEVDSDSHGILQDVHWSGMSFGYFPTYALGSAYGAQILHHMKKDLDTNNIDIVKVNAWLKDKIHKYGSLYAPKDLFLQSLGEKFNPNYYIDYLIDKFSSLYGLK
jgi:carboxypeptidase Taq